MYQCNYCVSYDDANKTCILAINVFPMTINYAMLNCVFTYRMCQYERYDMPYQQTYKTLVREDYTTNCGTWRWKSCVKTRYCTI